MATDVLSLLKRSSNLERMAASVYEVLAQRFAADAELAALWASLARDEHEHASALDAVYEPMLHVATRHRPEVSGVEEDIADVHWLIAESRNAAATSNEEEAFAIALAIENSELDAISAAVMQAASIVIAPNVAAAMRHDTTGHHEKLLALAKRRCRAETTMRRAALLAAGVNRHAPRASARAEAPGTPPPTPRARRTP